MIQPTLQQTTPVGRHGELRLIFTSHNHKTALTESYFRTPLQVMRSIPDQAGCVGVYLLSPTGGVVQNDRYHIDIMLEANTHALVTTVAATKVYRMPHGKAIQRIDIHLGENAILEFVPDALILFKDSDFEQVISIHLAPGAICLFQDSVMGGRVAHHGELFQFRQFKNQLKIYDTTGMIVYDKIEFSPTLNTPKQQGLLDGCSCWGSAFVVGDVSRFDCDRETFCHTVNLHQPSKALTSISTLHRNGFGYRILADRLEDITQAFESLRQHYRSALNIPYTSLRR